MSLRTNRLLSLDWLVYRRCLHSVIVVIRRCLPARYSTEADFEPLPIALTTRARTRIQLNRRHYAHSRNHIPDQAQDDLYTHAASNFVPMTLIFTMQTTCGGLPLRPPKDYRKISLEQLQFDHEENAGHGPEDQIELLLNQYTCSEDNVQAS